MGKKKRKAAAFDPVADTGMDEPVRVRIAARDVNDRFSTYPSVGLNPVRLASILREANDGNVRRQMELFEEMEEKDPHLFSQMQTRKLAVTGLEWEVQPSTKEPEDQAISEFVSEQLTALEGFDAAMFDMLDAIGKGISVLEIEWDVDAEGHDIIRSLEWIHPKKLVWDFEKEVLKRRVYKFQSDCDCEILLPLYYEYVHKYKAKSGHESRAGVMRIIAWMYMFKNFDLKDWVAFSEVYGMPLRLGKYDASASKEDRKQLMDAIYTMGTDAAGIIPTSADISIIESNKTTSADIFEKFARYADEQMSKAILGQTLSSDSGGGSYAQGKVHNEVRHDLTVADAKSLAETIRKDIIQPLVLYNFGPDAKIPLFVFNSNETDDLKVTAEIYKTLICDMGLSIPVDHVYKKFSIPKPEKGEAVLEAVQKKMEELTEGQGADGGRTEAG